MSTRLLHIRADDSAVHERFHAFVPLVFRTVDFRLWDRRGGWNDDYEAFLLTDGDALVASVGLTRMNLSIAGHARIGYQLGAVATHPQHRGQGHARELLTQVLARIDAQAAPALLFANADVLAFYPRFGFRPLPQRRYVVAVSMQPAGPPAPPCDVADAVARAQLQQLCAAAGHNDTGFGARDYYGVLLWHLSYRPIRAYWLDQGHALAVVAESDGILYLHDLLATRPFDLEQALAQVIAAPVRQIEFGFRPQACWPSASDVGNDDEGSPLFVRGMDELHAAGLRFPDLAQT